MGKSYAYAQDMGPGGQHLPGCSCAGCKPRQSKAQKPRLSGTDTFNHHSSNAASSSSGQTGASTANSTDQRTKSDRLDTLDHVAGKTSLRSKVMNAIRQGKPDRAMELIEKRLARSNTDIRREHTERLAADAAELMSDYGQSDHSAALTTLIGGSEPSTEYSPKWVNGVLVESPEAYKAVTDGTNEMRNCRRMPPPSHSAPAPRFGSMAA